MLAIHTKFLPANNRQGARIKAYTVCHGLQAFTAIVSVDHSLNGELVHFEAVKELVKKHNLDWDLTDMRYGDSADWRGYVFCFNNSIVAK
jgi:hypothetical protein